MAHGSNTSRAQMGAEPSAQLPATHTSSTTHPPVRCKQSATYCWAFGTWGALHKHPLNKREEKKKQWLAEHILQVTSTSGLETQCFVCPQLFPVLLLGLGIPEAEQFPFSPSDTTTEKPNAIYLDHAGHGRTALLPSTKPHHSTGASSIKKTFLP